MPCFGKPNRTGRSSGKHAGRLGRLNKPPKGEPWVYLTQELLSSPAWRAQSINCRRLIEFLLDERMNHAGQENGKYMATYDQLHAWGIPRSEISGAIREAEFLGLVRRQRGTGLTDLKRPSLYRLTFYADFEGHPPTNEWKGKTPEAIAEWKKDRSQNRKKRAWKKQKQGTTFRTQSVRLSVLSGGKDKRATN